MDKEKLSKSKPCECNLNISLVFYKEEPKPNTWGSNTISYEISWHLEKRNLIINEVGAFGDRTLVKFLQNVSAEDIGDFIDEVCNLTYGDFKKWLELGLSENG